MDKRISETRAEEIADVQLANVGRREVGRERGNDVAGNSSR